MSRVERRPAWVGLLIAESRVTTSAASTTSGDAASSWVLLLKHGQGPAPASELARDGDVGDHVALAACPEGVPAGEQPTVSRVAAGPCCWWGEFPALTHGLAHDVAGAVVPSGNSLTPRISNRGAHDSDTLALLTLVTGRSVAAQRPRIRPPETSNGGGTWRPEPRLRRSGSVPPETSGRFRSRWPELWKRSPPADPHSVTPRTRTSATTAPSTRAPCDVPACGTSQRSCLS